MENKIVIYKEKDADIQVDVNLHNESVWLTQAQMAELFKRDRDTVSEHIVNIFKEGELNKNSVTRKFRATASDGKVYQVNHYNLDVIISVGYRVRSKRGTQFRIWATNVLRKHIVDGYTINQKRLEQTEKKWQNLQIQMKNLKSVLENKKLDNDQSKALIKVITDYSGALELIDLVDKKSIPQAKNQKREMKNFIYEDFVLEVDTLREKMDAGFLFGQDNKDGLRSALKSIEQSVGGTPVYDSVEKKAANLLYLIIKNHPFVDGNKRIGSYSFIRYLDINNLLYREDISRKIDKNTLVALALLIAQSNTKDKDLMIDLVIYLINME